MAFLIPLAAAGAGAGLASTAAGVTTAGIAAAGLSGLGAGISAYGAITQGQAAAQAAAYSSKVAQNNATIASQNASIIAANGDQQVAQEQQKTRAKVGGIVANQAASGLDVNSGSAVDVRSSASELGELNAINIRANATRQAYGQQVQETSDTAQSNLDQTESGNDSTAGLLKGGATLLSSTGDAWTKFSSTGNNNTFPTDDINNELSHYEG